MSTRPPNPDAKCLTSQWLPPPLGVELPPSQAAMDAADPHTSVPSLDPADMSPHQRLAEVADLLATGFRRSQRRLRGLDPASSAASGQHQLLAPTGLEPSPSPATHGSPVVDAGREEVP